MMLLKLLTEIWVFVGVDPSKNNLLFPFNRQTEVGKLFRHSFPTATAWLCLCHGLEICTRFFVDEVSGDGTYRVP
jgi:hypothetical protein